MLLKRIYGINEMKILWFAISYPFKKGVWDKSNENVWICDFLHFYKGCMG